MLGGGADAGVLGADQLVRVGQVFGRDEPLGGRVADVDDGFAGGAPSGARLAFFAVTVLATVSEPIACGSSETPTPARPASAIATTAPPPPSDRPAAPGEPLAPPPARPPLRPEAAEGAVADRVLDVAPGELGDGEDRGDLEERRAGGRGRCASSGVVRTMIGSVQR